MNIQIYYTIGIVTTVIAILYAIIAYFKYGVDEIRETVNIDINHDEMENIEQLVRQVKKEHKLDDDTPLCVFAQAINVKEGKPLKDIHTKAVINPPSDDGYMYVDYSIKLSAKEKLFALGHECGHVLNKHPIPNTLWEGRGKPEDEQIADYTAAAIIMPQEKIKNMLIGNSYCELGTKQKRKLVLKICKKYNVSESSAIKRIMEVRLLCGLE